MSPIINPSLSTSPLLCKVVFSTVTPEIDDVLLNAQKTFQAIDEVVKGLGIPLTTGIMEILFKGTVIKKDQYQLDDLKAMVEDLEKKLKLLNDLEKNLISIENDYNNQK